MPVPTSTFHVHSSTGSQSTTVKWILLAQWTHSEHHGVMSPSRVTNTAQNACLPFWASHFLACGRPWPGLPLYPRSHFQGLSGQLDHTWPLALFLGHLPSGTCACRAGKAPRQRGLAFRAPGLWGGGCSNNGGVTCEGKSVLFYFLLEVFDLKVPFLQQLIQSPVLIHCFPELMAKLLNLIFKHPARQRRDYCFFMGTDGQGSVLHCPGLLYLVGLWVMIRTGLYKTGKQNLKNHNEQILIYCPRNGVIQHTHAHTRTHTFERGKKFSIT